MGFIPNNRLMRSGNCRTFIEAVYKENLGYDIKVKKQKSYFISYGFGDDRRCFMANKLLQFSMGIHLNSCKEIKYKLDQNLKICYYYKTNTTKGG
jgi:hypothetical protein